jgi:NADPH2:quinone reductase
MKALLCTRYGLPDSLSLSDVPLPQPASGEVRIQVKACGVNFPDILMIQDKYQFKPPIPFAPGGEISGIVDAVGEGVAHLQAGDRVVALSGWGGFAEYACVPARRTSHLPHSIDFLTAATTLYTYGTSLHALKDRAQLRSGETLLVLGAGGGVGLAAVELGHQTGATVIAAASSDEKLALCREKGAAHLINYQSEDLRTRLKALAGDKGVDVVYDPVGGPLTESALRSMAWRGRYLVVGFAAGDIPKIPLNLPLLKGCSIMGVFWGSFSEKEPAQSMENFKMLLHLAATQAIRPHIHKVYSLETAAQALTDLTERRVIGKAVVEI